MQSVRDEEFRDEAARVVRWIEDYRRRLPDLPVLPDVEPGDVLARLPATAPERPDNLEAILLDLDRIIVPGLTHWNHPGFLAYFSSSSSDPGVLAEFIAAALNVNAMLWKTAPAASELETRMIDWVRAFVGLPDRFEGVIQDTASSSSFAALVAARERALPDSRLHGLAHVGETTGAPVVYQSEHAHSSIDKAAIASGIGLDNIRRIGVDERYRMRAEELQAALLADREAGRTPVMVCATIGTTSTTSIDPVREIADLCGEHDVWLHVDAAYAGPAAALPEMRSEFAGWEDADSVVINPHKWLSTPIDCSVFLYRDPEIVRRSLAATPAYLETGIEARNLMDFGLPLGRRFRALKLWFLFRREGAEAMRDRLRWHMLLARRFAARIDADDRFERVAPTPFSTVCFRAIPPGGEAGARRGDAGDLLALEDDWNRRLLDAVNRRGRVFLSHTELDGRFVIRLAIGSAHVREEDVDAAWSECTEAYQDL